MANDYTHTRVTTVYLAHVSPGVPINQTTGEGRRNIWVGQTAFSLSKGFEPLHADGQPGGNMCIYILGEVVKSVKTRQNRKPDLFALNNKKKTKKRRKLKPLHRGRQKLDKQQRSCKN